MDVLSQLCTLQHFHTGGNWVCFASLPAASHLHTGQLFLIVVGNLKVSLIGWLASEASEGVVIVFAVNVAAQ